MKTQSKKQRKVLVSMKISTIFAILILIILLAVVAVNVRTYIVSKQANANNLNQNNNNTQEEVNAQENVNIETRTIKINERNVVTSSRSSSRRENTAISKIENPEEEVIQEAQEDLVVVSTPIDEVKISRDMDLTVRTGLSKEDFVKLMSDVKEDTSGFFRENAEYIYDVCEKNSLNEIFFCGLISAESGWNIASAHRNTHNYISLMSSNGLIRFASVQDGLDKAGEVLNQRYLTPGGVFYYGKTLSAVKTRFCPVSSTWVNLVYGRMEQIIK